MTELIGGAMITGAFAIGIMLIWARWLSDTCEQIARGIDDA